MRQPGEPWPMLMKFIDKQHYSILPPGLMKYFACLLWAMSTCPISLSEDHAGLSTPCGCRTCYMGPGPP